MGQQKVNTFGKIGRLITKRKFAIIAVWILLLAIIIPIVMTASGYESMTLTSSTQTSSESNTATNIINKQFQTSVANDSLLLIISTNNASSLETQHLIDELVTKINSDSSITGVENVTSIYTVLISALNQTNQGVYLVYNNGNLTYNLLYSVPAIYSQVWYAAYNTALQDNLVPGLQQTDQAVYAVITNTNQTYSLLYSVPAAYSTVYATAYNTTRDQTLVPAISQTNQGVYTALSNANQTCSLLYAPAAFYLQYWGGNYQATGNVTEANAYAYQMTAATLQQMDPADYAAYTSNILNIFSNAWQNSFSTNPTIDPTTRAISASNATTQTYVASLASNATEQGFVEAVTNALPFQSYLTNTQNQDNAVLTGLAIQTVAAQGNISTQYVTAAYNLGANSSTAAMTSLAEDIIQNPNTYNMGTDFISQFNAAAYSQTQSILSAADPVDYTTYLAPLLSAFNSSWCQSFQNPSLSAYTPDQRATLVANLTNTAYVNSAFAGNATAQAFANVVINNFTLNDFLTNTQAANNAQLQTFAINYVAESSNASTAFVTAAYNCGNCPTNSDLTALASQIIWSPSNYAMPNFASTFNQVSYNQTQTILKNADESSYNQYTSHLLDYFNTAWTSLVPASATSTSWINSTAAEAANIANQKFIANYFSSNADFADKVASTFTLQDFLSGNTTCTNAKLQDFAVNYVANESGLSQDLVKAVYDLGGNASQASLQTLASNIVYSPDTYNVGPALNSAISSFVSPSQNMTIVAISFNGTNTNNVPKLRSLISDFLAANPAGISSIKVTGQDAISYDFRQSTNKDLDLILPVTLILLVGATALFFRSIITPLVTLGTIGVGLGVSMVFPYLVGTYINQVDYTIVTVLLTVLIGVGTDYSIFIIARHREERINGLPVTEAIKKSITWAGESIVTSGTTVIIAFLALSATSMVFLQTMGLIIGLGVIVTLVAALTFAPAVTAILGDRIFWPNTGERFRKYAQGISEKNQRKGGYFARSGAFSVKHGKAVILLAIVITVPCLFIYATTVQTYNFIGSAAPSLESISGYNSLTNTFGSGRMMPSYVVVTFSEPILYGNGSFNQGELSTLSQISTYIDSHEGIQKVTGPTMPYGSTVDYQAITNSSDPINYSGMLQAIGADNKSALITVEFTGDPYSTNAMTYAQNIRSTLHTDYKNTADVTGVYLGGTTGSILDVKNTFSQELNQIIPTVTICVALVLFFVLGSLFLPIFAVLSVFMSIFWTLAVTILVFHAVFGYGLLFITPLILIVLLLGLGMDYNIFILTRVREEAAKGQKLNDALVHAIQQTGGIITAAAIILAGSLGSLMLSTNLMLKELGFAFAFSILVDALVVRTYLVPAVMSIVGKWNWYNPIKRLRRVKDQE